MSLHYPPRAGGSMIIEMGMPCRPGNENHSRSD
jgi:hypothetical protein